MILRSVLLFFLVFSPLTALARTIAFDIDETLIQSDKLLNKYVENAKKLGFEVRTTENGQDYIVRPGAFEILDYAKAQGFDLIVISHNVDSYLSDVLKSSGLFEYFDKIISHEDLIQPVNTDFEIYPQHRNKTYPQWTIIEAYQNLFYKGFLQRSWQRLMGNKNIHPYLPSTNVGKYPPMHGARVLIDNAIYNIEDPVDFVGIKVEEFLANSEDQLSTDWVEPLKKDIDFLKEHGWTDLYRLKYNKEPITDEVILAN